MDEAVDAAEEDTASLLLSLCSTDGGSIQKPPTFGNTIMGYGGPACGKDGKDQTEVGRGGTMNLAGGGIKGESQLS